MAGFCCVRGPTKVPCGKVNHFRRFMISAVDHKTRCFRFVKQNLFNSAGDHHTVNLFAIAKSLKVFFQRLIQIQIFVFACRNLINIYVLL